MKINSHDYIVCESAFKASTDLALKMGQIYMEDNIHVLVKVYHSYQNSSSLKQQTIKSISDILFSKQVWRNSGFLVS